MTETRMKQQGWWERPKVERLASAMYPHLADASTQREMLAKSGPRNRAELQARIAAGQKAYGIKPAEPRGPRMAKVEMSADNLDRVPGLRRK